MKNKYILVAALLFSQIAYAQFQTFSVFDADAIPDYIDTDSSEHQIEKPINVDAGTVIPEKSFLRSFQWESKLQFQSNQLRQSSNTASANASLRFFGNANIINQLELQANIRARVEHSEGTSFRLKDQSYLDVQELALRYQINPSWNITLGRNNIRNGIASGFNPTDWFKAGSLVYQNNLDASARRDDRLGIVALHTTWANERILIHTGYRPDLSGLGGFWSDCNQFGYLCLGQTNPEHAYFFKLSPVQSSNMAWTGSVYYEKDRPGAGFEISYSPASSLIAYTEWFAQRRASLPDSALYRDNHNLRIYHQLAAGISWSIPLSTQTRDLDITSTIEFHYNSAGLGKSDLNTWRYAMDRTHAGQIAALAQWRQEPLAEQQWFFRLVWNNALDDLNLSLITTYVPWDKSGFTQLGVTYHPSQQDKIELLGYRFFGADNSVYGASQKNHGFSLTYTRQF